MVGLRECGRGGVWADIHSTLSFFWLHVGYVLCTRPYLGAGRAVKAEGRGKGKLR